MAYSGVLFFSMAIYQCEWCGCKENSTKGNLNTWHMPDMYSWAGIEDRKGMKLCSACSPIYYSDGKPCSKFNGQWHGCFERVFLPKGMFVTNGEGNLMHKETKDTNYYQYRIYPEGM